MIPVLQTGDSEKLNILQIKDWLAGYPSSPSILECTKEPNFSQTPLQLTCGYDLPSAKQVPFLGTQEGEVLLGQHPGFQLLASRVLRGKTLVVHIDLAGKPWLWSQ